MTLSDPGIPRSSMPPGAELLFLSAPERRKYTRLIKVPGVFVERKAEVDPLLVHLKQWAAGGVSSLELELEDWKVDVSADLVGGTPVSDFVESHFSDPQCTARMNKALDGRWLVSLGQISFALHPCADEVVLAAGFTRKTRRTLAGQYAVVHSRARRAVDVYVLLTEFLEDKACPGAEGTRGERGYDRAELHIALDGDGNVTSIRYPPHDNPTAHEGWLTRNALGNIIAHSDVPRLLPKLFLSINKFLISSDTGTQAQTERLNYSPVDLGLMRAAATGRKLSKDQLAVVLSTCQRKNLILRRMGLEPVTRLAKDGRIESWSYLWYLLETVRRDVLEDERFIARALKYYPEIVAHTVRRIFGVRVRHDENNWKVDFIGKGFNKQIYHFTGRPGPRPVDFVLSTIREDAAFWGYSRAHLDETLRIWAALSRRRLPEVPRLGAFRWFVDYHPSRLSEPLPRRNRHDATADLTGANRLFYNNILVVSREFVPGADLSEILSSRRYSRKYKRAATLATLRCHFSLFKKTEKDGRGVLLGDPKPKNSVVDGDGRTMTSRIIDLDCLYVDKLPRLMQALEFYGYDQGLVGEATSDVFGPRPRKPRAAGPPRALARP